jgi:hypothetical protein
MKPMGQDRTKWFSHILQDIKDREEGNGNSKRKDCGKTDNRNFSFINPYRNYARG